jgi:hypothetical protein
MPITGPVLVVKAERRCAKTLVFAISQEPEHFLDLLSFARPCVAT